jgi:hypothetical protein
MEDSSLGGLLIYPAYFKASIVRETEYSFTINIKNKSSEDIVVTPSLGQFSQQRDTNSNQFELTDRFEDLFEIEEATIEGGTTGSIEVRINVPDSEDFKDSSYFPAIILTQSAEETTDTTQIATEQVIPIYLDFSDDRNVSSSIETFSVPTIVFGTTSSFEIKIVNSGNTYFAPTSYIELHEISFINSDEQTRIETVPVSKGEPILLPESYISESIDWEREKFGRYEATLHVLNGETELETLSTSFWLVPKITFAYALAFVVGISLVVVSIKVSIKALLKRRIRKSS